MNFEKIKTTLEVYYIKSRTKIRTMVKLTGIVLVLIGAYNAVFVAGIGGEFIGFWPPIETIEIEYTDLKSKYIRISDVVVMFGGMMLTAFS